MRALLFRGTATRVAGRRRQARGGGGHKRERERAARESGHTKDNIRPGRDERGESVGPRRSMSTQPPTSSKRRCRPRGTRVGRGATERRRLHCDAIRLSDFPLHPFPLFSRARGDVCVRHTGKWPNISRTCFYYARLPTEIWARAKARESGKEKLFVSALRAAESGESIRWEKKKKRFMCALRRNH